ncbi:MAG: hypothetical protein ACRDJG_00275 [Actinomycetota bacterium]
MKAANKASYSAWAKAYEAMYLALPEKLPASCPNCGQSPLRLVFIGNPASRIGYADFWCDNCLYGLRISRVEVPAGVEMLPFSTPDGVISSMIPNYEEVPYEEEDEDEVFYGD